MTIIKMPRTATVGRFSDQSTIVLAMSAVPPLCSSAVPIGIKHPSSTITGHSTDWYSRDNGTIRNCT